MPEILLILAIALIVIGPKKLPELAQTLGRAMGEFKRSAQDFKRSIDVETTLKDIETPASDLKDVIKEVNKKTIVEPGDAPPAENSDSSGETPDATFEEPDTSPKGPDSATPKDPENKNK